MLGHIIGQAKPKTASVTAIDHSPLRPPGVEGRSISSDHGRQTILDTINELQVLSRSGLWGILLFLALSVVALYCREAGPFPLFPESVRGLLGEPPPLYLLHIVLAISWLSAMVLILCRVAGDVRPGYSWCKVGLPTVFFPFYVFYDTAITHFME